MYFRQTSFELTTSYRKENWYGVKSLFFFSSKYKGSLLWVLSRSVIQDQWDYGSSEEPMNPLWTQIHRLLSVLSFFYHASFYSWSAGTMRARCESERGARDEKKNRSFRRKLHLVAFLARVFRDLYERKKNRLPVDWLHGLLQCTMIQVILDHRSRCWSLQRNAPLTAAEPIGYVFWMLWAQTERRAPRLRGCEPRGSEWGVGRSGIGGGVEWGGGLSYLGGTTEINRARSCEIITIVPRICLFNPAE